MKFVFSKICFNVYKYSKYSTRISINVLQDWGKEVYSAMLPEITSLVFTGKKVESSLN